MGKLSDLLSPLPLTGEEKTRQPVRAWQYMAPTLRNLQLVAALTALAVTGSGAVSLGLTLFREAATDEPTAVTLSDRTSELIANLEDAAAAISEIEAEVQARQALVSDLEEKQRTTEEILDLNEEQLEAITQFFGNEVTANRSFLEKPEGTFVIALATGVILFVAGIAVDHWLIPRLRRRSTSETNASEPDQQ